MHVSAPRLKAHQLSFALSEEPPELRGVLFQQDKNATVTLLKHSGQTAPDSEPDVGDDAAIDGEVYISVDGIGQDWNEHRRQIQDLFHGGSEAGVHLDRPIIGIHEGQGKNSIVDGMRIVRNTLILKSLQAHLVDSEVSKELAYRGDPGVKTIYDQLRQSLEVGRKITLMAHSGGGVQAALAMSILAEEEIPKAERFLRQDVRIMGMAMAASREDFELAGLSSQNILTTGSRQDPVHRIFGPHMSFGQPLSIFKSLATGIAKGIRLGLKRSPEHSMEYIMEQNKVDGSHRLQEFLNGGVGSDLELL